MQRWRARVHRTRVLPFTNLLRASDGSGFLGNPNSQARIHGRIRTHIERAEQSICRHIVKDSAGPIGDTILLGLDDVQETIMLVQGHAAPGRQDVAHARPHGTRA